MSETIQIREIVVDGVRTRYIEAGTGDSVIFFLHGGHYEYRSATSAEDWTITAANMASRFGYRAIAIDKLGAGETDSPRTDDGYTMSAVISHAWETIQALGIRKCAIVGHSRGALPAARIALDHPEVITDLVVVSSNTLAAEDPVVPLDFWNRPYPEPDQVATPEALTELIDSSTYSRTEAGQHILERKLARLANPHPDRPHTSDDVARVSRLTTEVFLPNMTEEKYAALDRIRQGELQVPSLLFWGLDDVSAPLKIGFDLFQLVGMHTDEAVQMHVFNKCRHWAFLEHASDFEEILHAFLSR